MADDSFRSHRGRDPLPRQEASAIARDGVDDPLAELARLIGQGDPYAEGGGRDAYGSGRSGDANGASGLDWAAGERYAADDGYDQPDDRGQGRYAPTPPAPPYSADAQLERDYDAAAPAADRCAAAPPRFNGFAAEPDPREQDERRPPAAPRQLPAFIAAPPRDRYEAEEPEHSADEAVDEAYEPEEYYDDPPSTRRRSGFVIVMAVLGLVVIGTAGAFAYRTMFGGLTLPGLPPIIKASNGPNKIIPSNGEGQANNSAQPGAASGGTAEKIVSREEQPVEPPKVAPRVVSTIPISPGQGLGPPNLAAPVPSGAGASVPPPQALAPTPGVPPAPIAASAPSAPPANAEPKRVHTVVIRADQAGGTDAQPAAPASPPIARPAARPAPTPPKPSAALAAPPAPVASNAPLSIIPGAEGEAVPPAPAAVPARARPAPMTVASAGPVTGVAATPPSGGYTVQVTSQQSEADAQASFKALRAKFPAQLGSREPIIRRADLGAKGVYYRALVGPFASMEEAAGMCSSLKAAGGNCLVQRN